MDCQKHVEPPAYLRNRFRGQVTFDLTPIMRKENKSSSTGRYDVRLEHKSHGLEGGGGGSESRITS